MTIQQQQQQQTNIHLHQFQNKKCNKVAAQENNPEATLSLTIVMQEKLASRNLLPKAMIA
jgi:hypothetical protein